MKVQEVLVPGIYYMDNGPYRVVARAGESQDGADAKGRESPVRDRPPDDVER